MSEPSICEPLGIIHLQQQVGIFEMTVISVLSAMVAVSDLKCNHVTSADCGGWQQCKVIRRSDDSLTAFAIALCSMTLHA